MSGDVIGCGIAAFENAAAVGMLCFVAALIKAVRCRMERNILKLELNVVCSSVQSLLTLVQPSDVAILNKRQLPATFLQHRFNQQNNQLPRKS